MYDVTGKYTTFSVAINDRHFFKDLFCNLTCFFSFEFLLVSVRLHQSYKDCKTNIVKYDIVNSISRVS